MKYLVIQSIVLLIVNANTSIISSFSWPVVIQGQWKQSAVAHPVGPCQPCLYEIAFNDEIALFKIKNSLDMQRNYEYAFSKKQEKQNYLFVNRQVQFKGENNQKKQAQSIKIIISSRNQVSYAYELQIVQIGLYIKDQVYRSGVYHIIQTILFALVLCLFIPVRKQSFQRDMDENQKRTSFFALYMYAQTLTTITAITGISIIQYVYYTPNYFLKALLYCFFGFSCLVFMIHTTYSLAIIQKKINHFLVRNTKCKLFLMLFGVVGGLISYPLIIIWFSKGIWYFYFCLLGLILQTVISYTYKTMPYKKFFILNSIAIVYLLLQSDTYPVLNFREQSYKSMGIFLTFLVCLLGGIGVFLRKTKFQEQISVMFEVNSRREDSSINAEQEGKREKKLMKLQCMEAKSDYELDEPKFAE